MRNRDIKVFERDRGMSEWRLTFRLEPGRVILADRALRVNTRAGVDGCVTDRASCPGRDGVGRVVVVPRVHWVSQVQDRAGAMKKVI